jgi:hypothetical protein
LENTNRDNAAVFLREARFAANLGFDGEDDMHGKTFRQFFFIVLIAMAACTNTGDPGNQEAALPTDTLAPIVSMTPRFTATPLSSRTPLPTFTLTPSETPLTPTPSNTPTPTATPPITGIVASLETVNVREGPGVTFSAITALVPGTGVEVLGQNTDGRWLNIKLENGEEGWIATSLVRINPTPTPIPTPTTTPDLTAIALGTPLPTAVLGGGTITPTPPRSVITPSPVGTEVTEEAVASGTLALPVIDVDSIQQTATALASGVVLPQATPTFTPFGPATNLIPGATSSATVPPITPGVGSEGNTAGSQQGVDVLAYCDNRVFGKPPPTGLRAGATIDVFWSWYTSDPNLMQQHLDNVIYDVRVNGVRLENWRPYDTNIRRQADGNYYIYWFVPYGPLTAGQYTITYSVTWTEQITDGYDFFGPGTNRPSESGTCTFTVEP